MLWIIWSRDNEGITGVQISFWWHGGEGGFIDMCVNNLNINLFVILLIPPLVTGRHITYSTVHKYTVHSNGNGNVVRIIEEIFQRSNGGD